MRTGAFSAADFQFGTPIAVAKPADNKYPLFDPQLLALGLNNTDLQDLSARVNDVYDTLRAANQFVK